MIRARVPEQRVVTQTSGYPVIALFPRQEVLLIPAINGVVAYAAVNEVAVVTAKMG